MRSPSQTKKTICSQRRGQQPWEIREILTGIFHERRPLLSLADRAMMRDDFEDFLGTLS
jgi:hypothetical protein